MRGWCLLTQSVPTHPPWTQTELRLKLHQCSGATCAHAHCTTASHCRLSAGWIRAWMSLGVNLCVSFSHVSCLMIPMLLTVEALSRKLPPPGVQYHVCIPGQRYRRLLGCQGVEGGVTLFLYLFQCIRIVAREAHNNRRCFRLSCILRINKQCVIGFCVRRTKARG